MRVIVDIIGGDYCCRLKERGWTNRNDMKLASSYAARITQASLKGMFANASTIMGWLADVAREVSRNGGTETDAHGKPLGDIIQCAPLSLLLLLFITSLPELVAQRSLRQSPE